VHVPTKTAIVSFGAFACGVALLPLGLPRWVFSFALVVSLLTVIAVGYAAAWRQGHSGTFLITQWSGKFGVKGAGLSLSKTESAVVVVALAFFGGLLSGLLWIVAAA
jgi:hypothetical protein